MKNVPMRTILMMRDTMNPTERAKFHASITCIHGLVDRNFKQQINVSQRSHKLVAARGELLTSGTHHEEHVDSEDISSIKVLEQQPSQRDKDDQSDNQNDCETEYESCNKGSEAAG